MNSRIIGTKTLAQWLEEEPALHHIMQKKELLWLNPYYTTFETAEKEIDLTEMHVFEAEKRWQRFAPYVLKEFPETKNRKGMIESPLINISSVMHDLEKSYKTKLDGTCFLKCDNELAISGSIKARGGIYEILKHAEDIALREGLLQNHSDYSCFKNSNFHEFFSEHSITVGSTGNLGLSIGIMGAKLGFQVFVHMSSDARQWKKDLLRRYGVSVVEHQSDYSTAVKEARLQARNDPNMYFIDDENSRDLFLGYATAASRLAEQLKEENREISEESPLFVYLPCGVGGGPGGICFGLKLLFKDNAHCFFAEPTASPCMLLGLLTRLHGRVSVRDFNLSNATAADGLAVARASSFVGETIGSMISGVYTISDDSLFFLLYQLANSQSIYLEPSALAGVLGPLALFYTEEGRSYLHRKPQAMKSATHVIWATGGNMVPKNEMTQYYYKGADIARQRKN